MLGICAVSVALWLSATAGSATGSECPPPGGADPAFTPSDELMDADHALRLVGGGWGHGVGMSQYGARGAAEMGCSYEQILTTYYTGTEVEAPDPPGNVAAETVRVGFLQRAEAVHVTHTGEGADRNLRWHLCDGGGCERPVDLRHQQPGEVWRVHTRSDGSYVVDQGGDETWEGGEGGTLRVLHEDVVIEVSDDHPDEDPGFSRLVRWGRHEIIAGEGGDHDPADRLYAVQHVTSGDGHSGMQRYLWGVAEVPSRWHEEVLRAQALTARSFASLRIGLASREAACRCDLRPTVADQHYTGWVKEAEGTDGEDGQRWKDAVNETAGEVVTYEGDDGEQRTADTFYSSSTGGWTENSEDVWVAPVRYLRAIDTSRWEGWENEHGQGPSPFRRWERGFSAAQLEDAFGLDEFVSFEVVERGDGGRPVSELREDGEVVREAGVEVRGVRDGDVVTERYSGEQLRWTLGLRSGLAYVPADEPIPAERHGGDDRIGTAVAVARAGWEAATSVVIARSDDPADALAGASLAGQLDAPLLITTGDHLAEEVADAIDDLGADHAILLGGEAALSRQVEEDLEERAVAPERIDGDDRVGTAVAIADRLSPGPAGTALLVFSSPADPERGWPDALSVSGLAARTAADGAPWPILLTGGELAEATLAALDRHGIDEVRLVGGTAVISEESADELDARGYATVRHAGADRYATSRAIVAVDDAVGQVIAATGRDFPDGLAAGALAARLDASVLLVPQGSLDDVVGHRKWIRDRIDRQPGLVVVGGTAAVSTTVQGELRDELRVR